MAKTLVLQHSPVETLGIISDALHAAGHTWHYVRVFSGEPVPESLAEADGLIAMGGPMGVYETDRYPFLRDEVHLVRAAIDAGKLVLGVCLGSQLLASALGARVYPGQGKEIGWYPVHLTPGGCDDPVFARTPSVFPALHWHGDIFDLPVGATSIGHSDLTRHQGFSYGANAYGLLFHLETTRELLDGMVQAFPDEIAAAGTDAQTLLAGKDVELIEAQSIGHQVFEAWARLLG